MSDERLGLPSASTIHRLAACPGSHRLCRGIPDEKTEDSSFGTHVHEFLAGTRKLEDLTPEESDIAEACQKIETNVVREWKLMIGAPEDADIIAWRDVERMWLMVDGRRVCSGVADALYLWAGRALVLDFKTLPGDHKDAQENLQLRCLAVLATTRFHSIKRVDVAIIQPLVTHTPQVCRYDTADLVLAKAELLGILNNASQPDAPLKTGDHCKFCRASSICPAVRAEVTQFSALTIHESGLSVSDEEMAELRARTGAAKKMIAAIEAEAFRRAQADPETWKRLGWYIAEGSGKRTVTNVSVVADRLEEAGASMSEIAGSCQISMKNVTALARKATGLKGIKLENKVGEILDGCITTKVAKPSLKRLGSADDEDFSEE